MTHFNPKKKHNISIKEIIELQIENFENRLLNKDNDKFIELEDIKIIDHFEEAYKILFKTIGFCAFSKNNSFVKNEKLNYHNVIHHENPNEHIIKFCVNNYSNDILYNKRKRIFDSWWKNSRRFRLVLRSEINILKLYRRIGDTFDENHSLFKNENELDDFVDSLLEDSN